jgi:hypothetical protein
MVERIDPGARPEVPEANFLLIAPIGQMGPGVPQLPDAAGKPERRQFRGAGSGTSGRGCGKTRRGHKMRPQGLKPAPILGLYAALKRRSSTVLPAFVALHAFVVLHVFSGLPHPLKLLPFARPRRSEFSRNLSESCRSGTRCRTGVVPFSNTF